VRSVGVGRRGRDPRDHDIMMGAMGGDDRKEAVDAVAVLGGPEEKREMETEQDEDVCAVCLEPYDQACISWCSHTFCRTCILKTLVHRKPSSAVASSCPLCRKSLSVYTLRDRESGQMLAAPQATSIFGLVFTQQSSLGVASYHFDSPKDCYISYSDKTCSRWCLDDGSQLPQRVYFRNKTWNARTRLFTGCVYWVTGFRGARRWNFEMYFDEHFYCITSGKVADDRGKVFQFKGNLSGDPISASIWRGLQDTSVLYYRRWLPWSESCFGSVFVQGRTYQADREGHGSYHFENPSSCYISYAEARKSGTWRLDDGSLMPDYVPFTSASFDASNQSFRGTVCWSVPLAGATRSEYDIRFSSDFGRIVAGDVRNYDSGDALLSKTLFADPQDTWSGWRSMTYVRKPSILSDALHQLAVLSSQTRSR